MSEISNIHQEALDIYLSHQQNNPSFTFYLRTNKSVRLNKGYWFQGDDSYVFTSPYRLADDNNKTQQIGFVENLRINKCYLEIPLLHARNKELEDFYKEVLKYLGLEYKGWGRVRDNRYQKEFNDNNWQEHLKKFLNKDVPKINNIAKKHNISDDKLFFSKQDFSKRLAKIRDIQSIIKQADLYDKDPSNFADKINDNVHWYFGIKGRDNEYPIKALLADITDSIELGLYPHFTTDQAKSKLKNIFGEKYVEFIDREQNINPIPKPPELILKTTQPLNQILYGPPGTGKTYSTVKIALDILGSQDKDSTESISELKKNYPEQVEFITFHQSFSYEDFIEGLKAQTIEGKIEYTIESGVFKKICQKAGSGENNFEECYNKFINDILDNDNQLLPLKTQSDKTFNVCTNSNQNLSLHTGTKEHYSGVATKEKIYQEYIGNTDKLGWYGYYRGIVAYLKKQYQLVDYQPKNNKNYVLIIDEINRGNISQILGELITLIEPNKRMGEPEALSVQLPYSKDDFSVPNNLYIIATMNTADRSLTLLDTALRRRFEFVEMPPKSKILGTNIDGIDLVQLLNTINERILFLYDKEHQIGHSYLMEVKSLENLQQAFKTKILPLLEEYFFDDWQKIRQVLNDNENYFYKEIKVPDNQDYGDKKVYQRVEKPELEAFEHIYQNTKDNEQGN